ncbi:MAG: pyridoxamine 5'-phosphate oxidase family protein [Bauldia sp.]
MYNVGSRDLQGRFGSTALADRLIEKTHRTLFDPNDQAFIESCGFFFLASADREGQPDISFKGGPPGFVRVLRPNLLVFPDYDGNGMFKSLGNIRVNPHVALLFIAMTDRPSRLRVLGEAEVALDDPLIATFPGGQLLVRVTPTHIFPNCPRYIPQMEVVAPSPYLPAAGVAPVEPGWKRADAFRDVVPPRRTSP